MKIESAGIAPLSANEAPTKAGHFNGRALTPGADPAQAQITLAELLDWLGTELQTSAQSEQHLQRLLDGDITPLHERRVRLP